MTNLTHGYLKECLDYDPETGVFTWREREDRSSQWNGRFAGKVAGYCGAKGYWKIRINDRARNAHRLVWLYMTGQFPHDQVDHINMDRADNRWCNLREATNAENNRNRRISPTNRSGRKGVDWHRSSGKFRAQIKVDGKKIHIGIFDKIDDAASAYAAAAERYHGEFARVA